MNAHDLPDETKKYLSKIGSSAMLEELKDTWVARDEHSKYPRCDWLYEAQQWSTTLGYWEWVLHNLQSNGESVHDFL